MSRSAWVSTFLNACPPVYYYFQFLFNLTFLWSYSRLGSVPQIFGNYWSWSFLCWMLFLLLNHKHWISESANNKRHHTHTYTMMHVGNGSTWLFAPYFNRHRLILQIFHQLQSNVNTTRAKVIHQQAASLRTGVLTLKNPLWWGNWGLCLTQCYFGPQQCPCQMATHSVQRL